MPVETRHSQRYLGGFNAKLARDKADILATTQKLEREGAEAKEERAHLRELEAEAEWEAARPQREAKARRKLEAERQQQKDVAGLKVRTARSDVVLGLVVAWQIVLTVGLLYMYVTLTGQPAEQATCPSPDE